MLAPRRYGFSVTLTAAALLLSACLIILSQEQAVSASDPGAIKVSAAASLREAFSELKIAFERKYAGARLFLNFGGTETLCTQIRLGDRPDVLASADVQHMQKMKAEGYVSGFSVFAGNQLAVLASRRRNAVRCFADLGRPGTRVLICDPRVPAGRYALDLLTRVEKLQLGAPGFREQVLGNVVSRELDVKQLVTKLILGEADAGFAYATDLNANTRGELRRIPLPTGLAVRADYTAALLKKTQNPSLARKFLALLLSPEGRAILAKHGFDVKG